MYTDIWHGAPYSDMGSEAYIKVLHKKDKDPLDPSSYRPISFINVGAKFLSKLVADRLADIMPTLINDTQSGFIRGRSGVANIRKVIMALEHAKANPKEDVIIVSLDGEKAFDNINWQWLFPTLDRLDFEGRVLNFLKGMYANPRARIDKVRACRHLFYYSKGLGKDAPCRHSYSIWRLNPWLDRSFPPTKLLIWPCSHMKFFCFLTHLQLTSYI